jgi:5-(carboxyamino)imidazole ribonucleotide mutase
VGVDNAANAAYLACEILALKYPEMQKSLTSFRQKMKEELAQDKGEIEL